MLPTKRLVLVVRASTKDSIPVITQDTTNNTNESSLVTKEERHPHYGFVIKSELHRDIYDALFKKGYQCLTEYINSTTKMQVVCINGHELLCKHRTLLIPCNNCEVCWDVAQLTQVQRLTQVITAQNGQRLSEFQGKSHKVEIRCSQGHIFTVSPGQLYNGIWCTICSNSNIRHAFRKFQEILKENGATLISEYVNAQTHVTIRCKVGHEYSQLPSDGNQGRGCPYCAGNRPEIGEKKFRDIVASKGGTVAGEYKNNHTKMWITCAVDHKFLSTPSYVCAGTWCRKCCNRCPEESKKRFVATVMEMGGILRGEYVKMHEKSSINLLFWS